MADGSANVSPAQSSRTISLPIGEEVYCEVVADARRFRKWLNEMFTAYPELFPARFAEGFSMKDGRTPKKIPIPLRRIELRDGTAYTVRPSFIMPYVTARTCEVERALFLRKFGVPFWALAEVFGRDHMFWFRQECSLGRNSIVGTTVRKAAVPEDLLADEHHQTRDGEKVYLATTVGAGCCLGVSVAESASAEDLTAAYGVFSEEARNVDPEYAPKTVNTDGWKATHSAWLTLFPTIVILRCFLHAWLKIRDRAKNLKEKYEELSALVWEAYHAPDKHSFRQRLQRLRRWASRKVSGVVREAVLDLCAKRKLWLTSYDHPRGHRTSNMLDRIMRPMYRYFFDGQHLHGSDVSSEQHVRGWALLWNFTPWHPATAKNNGGWQSPAERLNKHRYHDNWLQNLLISASLAGYRTPPQNP